MKVKSSELLIPGLLVVCAVLALPVRLPAVLITPASAEDIVEAMGNDARGLTLSQESLPDFFTLSASRIDENSEQYLVEQLYTSGRWKGGKAVIEYARDLSYTRVSVYDKEGNRQRIYSVRTKPPRTLSRAEALARASTSPQRPASSPIAQEKRIEVASLPSPLARPDGPGTAGSVGYEWDEAQNAYVPTRESVFSSPSVSQEIQKQESKSTTIPEKNPEAEVSTLKPAHRRAAVTTPPEARGEPSRSRSRKARKQAVKIKAGTSVWSEKQPDIPEDEQYKSPAQEDHESSRSPEKTRKKIPPIILARSVEFEPAKPEAREHSPSHSGTDRNSRAGSEAQQGTAPLSPYVPTTEELLAPGPEQTGLDAGNTVRAEARPQRPASTREEIPTSILARAVESEQAKPETREPPTSSSKSEGKSRPSPDVQRVAAPVSPYVPSTEELLAAGPETSAQGSRNSVRADARPGVAVTTREPPTPVDRARPLEPERAKREERGSPTSPSTSEGKSRFSPDAQRVLAPGSREVPSTEELLTAGPEKSGPDTSEGDAWKPKVSARPAIANLETPVPAAAEPVKIAKALKPRVDNSVENLLEMAQRANSGAPHESDAWTPQKSAPVQPDVDMEKAMAHLHAREAKKASPKPAVQTRQDVNDPEEGVLPVSSFEKFSGSMYGRHREYERRFFPGKKAHAKAPEHDFFVDEVDRKKEVHNVYYYIHRKKKAPKLVAVERHEKLSFLGNYDIEKEDKGSLSVYN